MNPLIIKLCTLIKEEMVVINNLKELSLRFRDITIHRDLTALEENNEAKRVALLRIVPIEKAKDSLISELAVGLGLYKDCSVREILDSKTLDEDSRSLLSSADKALQEVIKALDSINSFVAVILLSSRRVLRNSIDIFNLHGTVDSVYSRNVSVKSAKKNLKLNKRI